MKILKKVLLINWLYFEYQVVDFSIINFLTGKNGSGKSTIIDALQLLFLADTSGSCFNKAANDKSDRTLLGYIRGETGDDSENGNKYLRNSPFTTYVAGQFYDDIKGTYFTSGICFDYYSDSDWQREFFCYDGKFHDTDFIINGKVMDIRMLRKYLNDNYTSNKKYITETNKQYLTYFYGKLGALPSNFAKVFKKAVPFKPMRDVKKFIEEYIFDDTGALDTSLMRENISHYKELEKQAQDLKVQMGKLDEISQEYNKFNGYENSEILYKYLIIRAELESSIRQLKKLKADVHKNAQLVLKNQEGLAISRQVLDKMGRERDDIISAYNNNDIAIRLKNLNNKLIEKESQKQNISRGYYNAKKIVTQNFLELKLICKNYCSVIADKDITALNDDVKQDIFNLNMEAKKSIDYVDSFLNGFSAESVCKDNGFNHTELNHYAKSIMTNAITLSSKINTDKDRLTIKYNQDKKEMELLKKGIHTFPQRVETLKIEIQTQLKEKFNVDNCVYVLCELLEIKNERWRNAIEGYINSQKFYIVVNPKYFNEAVAVYDKIKSSKDVHSVGIINTKDIINNNVNVKENSLAEEIECKNQYARKYIDYLLGNVIKCNSVKKLTEYKVAITDDGMLYKGYVVRQINPELWKLPVIGEIAFERKIAILSENISIYEKSRAVYFSLLSVMDNITKIVLMSKNDVDCIIASCKDYLNLQTIERECEDIKNQIDNIDKSPLTSLEEEKNAIIKSIKDEESKKEQLLNNIIHYKDSVLNINKSIAETNININDINNKIKEDYNQDWIESTGNIKFLHECNMGKDFSTIVGNYNVSLSKVITQKSKSKEELVALRSTYINEYKEGYSVNENNNKVYDEKLKELKNVKLPLYIDKISYAKSKSYEQFQEDFLSRMKSNIISAENRIKEINNTLKGNFSEYKYKFTVTPNKDYKQYYDMFTNKMLEKGYNLFSAEFNEIYKNEINELFNMIVSGDNDDNYRKKMEMYSDYRTYLDFDLLQIDDSGVTSRLSKTLGKKSGGETQLPFYITVLASFAQIYRVGKNNTYETLRLIIFDEAFSKMDSERIKYSIELLRKFNFQVILSAPSEKIPDISTLVDRNLIVLRKNNDIDVKIFDPKEISLDDDYNE